MPVRTDTRNWPTPRPDYWAGERGGRPLPKRAPRPLRGDSLPANKPTSYNRLFRTHDEAVAYARLFDQHLQVKAVYVTIHDECTRMFHVDASRGRRTVHTDEFGLTGKVSYKRLYT